MIFIHSLSKSFNGTQALDDLSLVIRKGEFFGLLGPNGAGKSTLLNILVGYLRSESGDVTVNGCDLSADPLEVRRSTGFIPQEIALYQTLSAWENLMFFGSLYGLPRSDRTHRAGELLKSVGLWDRRNDKVKSFSGGMKRRLNIIAGLLHQPPLLLCDEPTVGVDPQSRVAIFEFLQLLHDQGTTIIYTTHYMEEAERLCTRIGILDHGHLIALGTLDELLRDSSALPTIHVLLQDGTAVPTGAFTAVGVVVQDGDRLMITPTSATARVSEILKQLEINGIPYRDVRFDRPSLESLFLRLTGRSLRE